jgi:diadenylate cyclase
VSRLPPLTARAIADHFGELAKLQRASVADLMNVQGVEEPMAKTVKETLERVTETTILDQYS